MNFLKLSYWFHVSPGPLMPNVRSAFLFVIICLVILTAIFFILKQKNKKKLINRVWKKLLNFSLTNTILALILLFFTDQGLPVLSSRFWFLIWGIGILIWLYFIRKVYLEVPKILAEQKKQDEYKKYIP